MGGGQPTQHTQPECAKGRLNPAAFGKMVSMNDTKLIEALSNASSLELFALSRTIDRLLADPRRIVAIRNQLNLGKTVHEEASRMQWKLSYAAIDPGEGNEPIEGAVATSIQPPVQKLGPQDFRRGDKVSFTDKYLQPQIGTITRINQRTASVECKDGPGWRVPYGMLSHVMDI